MKFTVSLSAAVKACDRFTIDGYHASLSCTDEKGIMEFEQAGYCVGPVWVPEQQIEIDENGFADLIGRDEDGDGDPRKHGVWFEMTRPLTLADMSPSPDAVSAEPAEVLAQFDAAIADATDLPISDDRNLGTASST